MENKNTKAKPVVYINLTAAGKLAYVGDGLFLNERGELFAVENNGLFGRRLQQLSKAYGVKTP